MKDEETLVTLSSEYLLRVYVHEIYSVVNRQLNERTDMQCL